MKTLTPVQVRYAVTDAVNAIIEDYATEPETDRDTVCERLDEETDTLFGQLTRQGRIDQYTVDDLITTAHPCAMILQVAKEAGCVESDRGLWEGLTFGVLASIAYFSLRNLLYEALSDAGIDSNRQYPFARE